jgi:sialic acid synthase SpsE
LEIIAELCQNHNGSRTNLLEMAKLAKRGGASYAKIQALYSGVCLLTASREAKHTSSSACSRTLCV